MTVLDAVERVLTEAGEPLHYKEIARRIADQQLLDVRSTNIGGTINASVSIDLSKFGDGSRFRRAGRGLIGLRSWDTSANSATPSIQAPTPLANNAANLPTEETTIAEIALAEATHPTQSYEPTVALSLADATERVLEQFGNKTPMHYRAITIKARELGLIDTASQTPEATLYASIYQEINRSHRRGDTPRFINHGRGYFGLSRWQDAGLAYEIEQHNADVRMMLRQRLLSTRPADFEALIGRLLVALGFDEVAVTGRSGDGGIDVRGTLVVGDVIRTRMAVQVKRWKSNVQAPIVQQVRGSLGTHEQGLIITTSDFSPARGAKQAGRTRFRLPS